MNIITFFGIIAIQKSKNKSAKQDISSSIDKTNDWQAYRGHDEYVKLLSIV